MQSDSWRTEDANHSACCGGGATGSSWTEKPCKRSTKKLSFSENAFILVRFPDHLKEVSKCLAREKERKSGKVSLIEKVCDVEEKLNFTAYLLVPDKKQQQQQTQIHLK